MTTLEWAQLAALSLAGAFFAFKVVQGWLMVNVTLEGPQLAALEGMVTTTWRSTSASARGEMGAYGSNTPPSALPGMAENPSLSSW